MRFLLVLVALAACGLPPDAPAGPDAGRAPDALPATFPAGTWYASATPTADCSIGALVGGAELQVTPGDVDALAVQVVGGPELVVISASCAPAGCSLDAYEVVGAEKVTYTLTLGADGTLAGEEMTGPTCRLPVEGFEVTRG